MRVRELRGSSENLQDTYCKHHGQSNLPAQGHVKLPDDRDWEDKHGHVHGHRHRRARNTSICDGRYAGEQEEGSLLVSLGAALDRGVGRRRDEPNKAHYDKEVARPSQPPLDAKGTDVEEEEGELRRIQRAVACEYADCAELQGSTRQSGAEGTGNSRTHVRY